MSYLYQKYNQYFAQIGGSLETYGVEELRELGAKKIEPGYRGAFFRAEVDTLYRINYRTRLATRILAPLKKFQCHSTKYLYRIASTIDWSDFMKVDQTFAVFANVSHSNIKHSKYAALVVKDAVVDQFREKTGERPSIDTQNPDLWINVHVVNNEATLSIDTSGGSLHRRGYRQESIEAPMQETLAAAIVRISGWKGETPLYDPMCGSGTLLIEAAMHLSNTPAAYKRQHFGFMMLPDYDEEIWLNVKKAEDAKIRELPPNLFYGSDMTARAVRAVKNNWKSLFPVDKLDVVQMPFQKINEISDSVIITNPPYGIRLGNPQQMEILYTRFGDFLKQKCNGSTAFVYCGERQLIKKIGLRTGFKIPLVNGQLDGRLVKFDLY